MTQKDHLTEAPDYNAPEGKEIPKNKAKAFKWVEESKKPPIIHLGENNLFRIVTNTDDKMHSLKYITNFKSGDTTEKLLHQSTDLDAVKKLASDLLKDGGYLID